MVFEVTVPAAAAHGQGTHRQAAHRQGAAPPLALVRSELLRTVGEVFADPQDIIAATAPGWIGVLHRIPAGSPTTSGSMVTSAAWTGIAG